MKSLRHIAVLLLALNTLGLAASPPSDPFDVPLKKQVVDFGPSPYSRQYRKMLACYFYPTFVVKEYDEGQKGAEWHSIMPTQPGVATACERSHAPGERVIGNEWGGYFMGVKGNLLFLEDADGSDGGMWFVVYDAGTGKKIFEDNAYDSKFVRRGIGVGPFGRMRVQHTTDGQVSLRYLRVAAFDCDLYREKAACWEQVRKKLYLTSTRIPACSNYKNLPTRWPSAVAYPVEVVLSPHPVIKTIAGPVRCWPVD